MQGYLAHEMFHVHERELVHQAQHQRLVNVAFRARLRNRKTARDVRALHRANDAVGRVDGQSHEAGSAVRAVR